MIERLTVFPDGDMEVKYRICVFGGNRRGKGASEVKKKVPTGVDALLITPYPICSRYEFETFSRGKDSVADFPAQ